MTTAILTAALILFAPQYLTPATAKANAEAAQEAAGATGLTATLLLAVTYAETRYEPLSLSRVQCSRGKFRRVTGVWTGTDAPPGSRGPYFCGPLQSEDTMDWQTCQRVRVDLADGYLDGAREILEWELAAPCRRLDADKRLECGLAGFNAGWRGARAGTNSYARVVLRTAECLRRALERVLDA